jgi:hypothetical protein
MVVRTQPGGKARLARMNDAAVRVSAPAAMP